MGDGAPPGTRPEDRPERQAGHRLWIYSRDQEAAGQRSPGAGGAPPRGRAAASIPHGGLTGASGRQHAVEGGQACLSAPPA